MKLQCMLKAAAMLGVGYMISEYLKDNKKSRSGVPGTANDPVHTEASDDAISTITGFDINNPYGIRDKRRYIMLQNNTVL